MFSGLIREFGEVISFSNNILKIKSKLNPNIGDSIAVNGACLTVIKTNKLEFWLELSEHTADNLAIENLKSLVHIETALKLNDGLHGHIVQGHIDGIGIIREIKKHIGEFIIEANTKYMIPKGSVCIDGISLTINEVFGNSFSLVIIPHTIQNTLFKEYQIGRRVNIESDVITRSVMFSVEKLQNKKEVDKHFVYDSIALGY